MKVLAMGIDTLKIGWPVVNYDPAFLERLATAKQDALESHSRSTWSLDGNKFHVYGFGKERYSYIVRNKDVELNFSERAQGGKHYPECLCEFRSEFLHRVTPYGAFKRLDQLVSSVGQVLSGKVSRLDLYADIDAPMPNHAKTLRYALCRGRKDSTHGELYTKTSSVRESHVTQTEQFGASGLLCRIYDKRAELANSDKVYTPELWKLAGWDGNSPVTRVEFELDRDAVVSLGLGDVINLWSGLSEAWGYLTTRWLRLTKGGALTHKALWPVTPFWKVTQLAYSPGVQTCLGNRTVRKTVPMVDTLQKQVSGHLSSIVARTLCDGGTIETVRSGMVSWLDGLFDLDDFKSSYLDKKAAWSRMTAQAETPAWPGPSICDGPELLYPGPENS